ncbi:MAG TPA: hypothetical protein VGH20_01965 [Myxococcales bacterium]
MTDDAKGGAALILSAGAGLLTMLLHPMPHDIFGVADPHRAVTLGAYVHGLAIAATVLGFLGAIALYRRTDDAERLSLSALVAFGFAAVAVTIAAAVSGFIAGPLALAREPTPRAVIQLAGLFNQAFAKIDVVATSAAILLWSLAIWRGRTLSRALAAYGFVIAPVLGLLVIFGWLRLDVHGFGLVVILQGAWLATAGVLLLRRPLAAR